MGAQPLAKGFDAKTCDDWRALAEKALKGSPVSALNTQTADGFTHLPLYARRSDAAALGHRTGAWSLAARMDHPDPKTANGMILKELAGGADLISLCFSGSAAAYGYGLKVGQPGLGDALEDIAMDAVGWRIEPHPSAVQTAGWLIGAFNQAGVGAAGISLSCGLDPIGQFARWGASADAVDNWVEAYRQIGDMHPHCLILEADGRIYHNAGATPGLELAAVLSTIVAYLRQGQAQGLEVSDIIGRLGIALSVSQNQFMSMAKLRAVRLLLSHLFDTLSLPADHAVCVHAETSYAMLSSKDVPTNILRSTIASLAAGAGGANSISVLPFTLPRGLPEDFARRVARNTQLLLLEESHIDAVKDPAAGSGGIEALTDELAAAAWTQFQTIEAEGGIITSLMEGKLQSRIADQQASAAAALAAGDDVLIGTSIYQLETEPHFDVCADVQPAPAPHFTSPRQSCPPLLPLRLAEPYEGENK